MVEGCTSAGNAGIGPIQHRCIVGGESIIRRFDQFWGAGWQGGMDRVRGRPLAIASRKLGADMPV